MQSIRCPVMADLPHFPVSRYSSASRLSDPAQFLREWKRDIFASPRIGWRLFQRGLIHQYRHSSLGIFLVFAPVLIAALLFTFGRHSNLLAAEIGGVNSAFFGACGMLMGQSFLEALNSTKRLFANNQSLFRRQNLPVEGPLLAIVIDLVFRLLIRLLVLALLMGLFSIHPVPTAPIAAWGLLGISLAGAGLGLIAAAPSCLQQDLTVLASILPLVLFTVTPVFGVPAPASLLGRIQSVNPLTWLFQGIRAAAYGGSGSVVAAAIGPVVGILLVLLGWFICRIARPHVVERILV